MSAGATITYDLVAENTGNVTLTGVQISEALSGSAVWWVPARQPRLAPGETTSCQFAYTATQGDIDSGSLTNDASVVGTPPGGGTVSDTDAVTLSATATPDITLTKTTSDTLSAGATITYDLVAENTGNVTLTNVQISEALSGSSVVGSCPAATLAPTETTSCQFAYTATQGDIDSGSLTNDASVVGTPPGGGTVSDSDAVTLSAAADPHIALTKTTTDTLSAGATITYDLVAENTGNVTLTNVQISEALSGSSVVGSCPAATLGAGGDHVAASLNTPQPSRMWTRGASPMTPRWWGHLRVVARCRIRMR